MPNPLLLDIVLYLTDKEILQGDGIDAYRDFIPEYPDNIVALHEYKGSPSIPMDEAVHRSVQVTCRNTNADLARQKALAIYKALVPDNEALIVRFTPDRWGQVYLRQPPFKKDQDDNERVSYCFNIGITTTIE